VPQFNYIAKESSGNTAKGIVEASDRKGAIDILRKKDLTIISLEEEKGKGRSSFSGLFSGSQRVGADDLVIFSRQLATVVEAGIPLVNALDIIGEQMEKPEMKKRIFKIRDDVEAGASLSEAISKDKQFFSAFFINMVKAGESSGNLDAILDRLAVYIEKSSNLQKKVKSALIYPAVVTGMALSITLLLLIKVIPVFKEIYAGFGATLPTPTQILINISDFLKAYFYVVAIIVALIIFIMTRYAKTAKGKRFFDRLKLNAPVFGPIIRKVAVSKFTRTFSTLVKSGVPILNSLDIVGKTAGNTIIEDAVEKVKTNVRDGENIATPLAKMDVFPPMVVRMISVGEKTSELEKMLAKISEFYDAQVEAAISGLTSLIEPLIIAFLGIVIGGIVLCMFLPILKISQIVSF